MLFGVGSVGRQSTTGLFVPTAGANPAITTLDPRLIFSRGSSATYFDNTGTMQTAGTNIPRFDYDPLTLQLKGLLIEESRTNSLRNSTMVGAAVGAPGTLPTNWTFNTPANGLTRSVVGFGTDSGMPYIDLRYQGTATGASSSNLFEPPNVIAALQNQTWTTSVYTKLVGGSTAGNITVSIGNWWYNSTPTIISSTGSSFFTPIATLLRRSNTVTLPSDPTIAWIRPAFAFGFTNGAVIDFTIRILAPQMELGAFATSFIPTTNVAVIRAADLISAR